MVYAPENNYSGINALRMVVELWWNAEHTAGMPEEELEKKIAEAMAELNWWEWREGPTLTAGYWLQARAFAGCQCQHEHAGPCIGLQAKREGRELLAQIGCSCPCHKCSRKPVLTDPSTWYPGCVFDFDPENERHIQEMLEMKPGSVMSHVPKKCP